MRSNDNYLVKNITAVWSHKNIFFLGNLHDNIYYLTIFFLIFFMQDFFLFSYIFLSLVYNFFNQLVALVDTAEYSIFIYM